jgi:hypothetical protein
MKGVRKKGERVRKRNDRRQKGYGEENERRKKGGRKEVEAGR